MKYLPVFFKLLIGWMPVVLLAAGFLVHVPCHAAGAQSGQASGPESHQPIGPAPSRTSGTPPEQAVHPALPQTARIGISQTVGTPETPFWLHANRDGRIPLYSRSNTLMFGEYHTGFLRDSDLFDMDAGFRLDARISDAENMLNFTEIYVHVLFRGWQLSAGRFYDTIGLNSGYLTTGSMLMSRNALQPYKLRLSTPGFLPVPLAGGAVSFRARWSEALLTDNRFVDRARIHQKYLYLRVRPVPELDLIAGIVHNLMWGGTHPDDGRMHTSFNDYLRDVLALPDDAASGNITPKGNGLGGYDFGAQYRAGGWTAGAWRLFFIEDGTAMNLRSPWDGVWGAWLDLHDPQRPRRLVSYVTYEHINTKWQDGGGYKAIGRARFYTHRVWRDGWVHHGQTLGTPLILIDPSKMGTRDQLLVNNMILGHHLGLAGQLGRTLSWEMAAIYSRNYGICRDQTSGGSCGGSAEEPVWERDDYVPYHTLRRDRYSFLLQLSFPVFRSAGQEAGAPGAGALGAGAPVAGAPDRRGASGYAGERLPSHSSGAVFGRTGPEHGPGWQVHLSVALDAGAFHNRPLFGFEAGLSRSL